VDGVRFRREARGQLARALARIGRVVGEAELVLLRRLPRKASGEVPDRALVRRRTAHQIRLIGPHVRVAGVLVEERRDVVPGAGVADGCVEPDLVALVWRAGTGDYLQ